MELTTKDLVTGGIILVLVIVTAIFAVRSMTNTARAEAANEMSGVLVQHLLSQNYQRTYPGCRNIAAGDYEKIEICLKDAMVVADMTKLFEEDNFKNVDVKKNTTGFIVIENKYGGKSFESANFTLQLNNEQIAEGCATPGVIATGYVCRFDFTQVCEPGYNLEILYNGKRAYLKTC